ASTFQRMDFNSKTVPLITSARDRDFLKSLYEFIAGEKESLCCPDEGSDEQRHTVYSAAFDKVIDYATSYKTILTAIKKEYDCLIASIKNNDRKVKVARGKLKTMMAQPTSLMYCRRRSVQLQERKKEPCIPFSLSIIFAFLTGLTFCEMLNPEALAKHLGFLEQKQADLLNKKKNQYVPVQVKADLEIKMRAYLNKKDELVYGCVFMVFFSLCCCGGKKIRGVPDHKPASSRTKYSWVFSNHRFMHMFEAGDYEAAAFHAARSPHGVLRNTETMERFKSVTVNDGGLPPLLLYFQALMISAQPGKQLLGETLCLEGVHCALQHGYIDLITFWVTQHRLTYSEELGDVLCSHGDKDPRIADTCLALAHIIYTTCGVLRKTALCMCKRGLTIGALEFIYQNNFTLDDTMFVLKGCPSLTLLQGLTQKYGSKPALLSVGYVCHSLLSSYLEDLAFQLLEKIIKAILDDMMCGTESWSEIAARCEQMNRPHLAQEIISTLLSQAGAVCLSPGSAKLMEHVFM
uniref:Clathrin heavy chain linker domain-containing protein 1 n=1 Tax=Electrophorus electricus TaxID=8005 RepID=A0AAY5EQC3_ELEEL